MRLAEGLRGRVHALTIAAFIAHYAGVSIGSHEFKVRAVDADAGADPSPESYSWTVEAPPTCGGQPATASASADSWNAQTQSSTNNGTDKVLRVKSRERRRERALVKFSQPAIPQGCGLESAKLRLYSSSFTPNRTLQALRLGGPWTELGVNWNTQPPPTGTAASAQSRSSQGYVEWDVTSQVQTMYTGANYGFLIRDANESAGSDRLQVFASRETDSQHPPELVISYK